MKITRELDVSTIEFYRYIEETLLQTDYAKERHIKQVQKGAIFVQVNPKNQEKVKTEILDYQPGKYYRARVTSNLDSIELYYQTKDTEKGIKVSFEQQVDSFNHNKSNKLMKLFSEGVYYGRMSDTLFNIKTAIHKKRNTID